MIKRNSTDSKETTTRPQRLAVLDLGTNTFHLLIADVAPDSKPVLVYHETVAVKLGEGGISTDMISADAFKRGIAAISKFKQNIDRHHVTTVKSAATSAIRTATNGKDFTKQVKASTTLDIEVIDGDREAELIYKGVRAAIEITGNSLIVDIGGGSVEFIIGDKNSIFWKKSYPIGAARLMEAYHHSDPISEGDITSINSFLDATLSELKIQLEQYQPELLIGSAGSFETFAEMQGIDSKASFDSPELNIELENYAQISELILKSTHREREAIREIPPVRVDMIVAATVITNYILQISRVNALKLSAYSLKEGLLFESLV